MVTYQAICEDSGNMEPLTVREALNGKDSEKWKQAMQDELESLYKNSAWILTELHEGQNVIDNVSYKCY